MESLEIETMDCLDSFYDNIIFNEKNYEWDIISIFKIYNSFIENPPVGYPTCHCPTCSYIKEQYPKVYPEKIKNIKKICYIMWFMKSITNRHILDKVKNFINSEQGKIITEKINNYYKFLCYYEVIPEENIWMEKEHYYIKIFDIPYNLSSIGIPLDHYLFREITYFNDMIAGNPRASHGWARESLEDTLSFGGIS